MTRSLPGAVVLLAAFVAVAATAVRLAPEPQEDQVDPGLEWPTCWNRLPFAAIGMEDRVLFEVIDAPDGPWAVEALIYALYPAYVEPAPGEEPAEPAPVLEGTFAEAAAAPEDARLRYEDVVGEPSLVEVGDRLVVNGTSYDHLEVRSPDGAVVGGTGLCL